MFSTVSAGVSGAYSYLWGSEEKDEESNNDPNGNNAQSPSSLQSTNRNKVHSKSAVSLPSRKKTSQTYTSYRHSNNNNSEVGKLRSHFKKKLSLKSSENEEKHNDTPLTIHHSYVGNANNNNRRQSWHYYTNSNSIIERSQSPHAINNAKNNNNNGNKNTNNRDANSTNVADSSDMSLEPVSRARGSAALSLSILFENDANGGHPSPTGSNGSDSNVNNNGNNGTMSSVASVSSVSSMSSINKNDPFTVTHNLFGIESKENTDNSNNSNDKNKNNNNNSNNKKNSTNEEESKLEMIDNNKLLSNYYDTLGLTKHERQGIENLHNWIKTDRLSMKLAEELCIGDLILSYFSHYSDTNPDPQGCWKRWIIYRNDNTILKDVNYQRIKDFIDSGVVSVGHMKDKRPIFIVNTQYYDDSFGPEVTAKAIMLFLTSLIWNIKTDQFDFDALRSGLTCYVNFSHWSMNMMSWRTLKAVKAAVVAFPFSLVTSYIVNPPTLLYLLRQFAAKVVVPHAIDKFKISTMEEFLELYANPCDMPQVCGGTSRMTATKWMEERGYLETIE